MATDLVWSKGHKNIVAIAAGVSMDQEERSQGYCASMRHLGGTAHVIWTLPPGTQARPPGVADRPSIAEATELAITISGTTAILVLSSNAVPDVMGVLYAKGRTPGKDISIVVMGCWDWMHKVAFPPISHCVLPYYEAGKRAATLFLALEHETVSPWERAVVIPPRLDAFHCLDGGTLACVSV
ncbi:MAG: substrate-binding domain-containing protein [Chloroflexota bacterium]|nr:substrate-binding domain-containing protein [Chloroflexota bacterium]